jgi:tetratricopeptide (TPR) repeat protein
MLEEQWQTALKHLENAMRITRHVPEFNLAMGECHLHLNHFKEAIQYFGEVIHQKPRYLPGWEALLKCLLQAGRGEEMMERSLQALQITDGKPLFLYYYSTALFSMGRTKEALVQLELALEKAPRHLKKFIDLHPSILRNLQVVDLIARYKKSPRRKSRD